MTALKKINAEAKRIIKKSPRTKWASAQKQAGAAYRAGKLGKAKTAPKKKTVKTVTKKRTSVSVGSMPASVGYSVSGTISVVRKSLAADIGKLEAKKFMEKTKSGKRKISKLIAEKKKQYRKFS